jgi:hypothetical protein
MSLHFLSIFLSMGHPNAHVVDDDALVNDSSSPHVANDFSPIQNAPGSLTPLHSDNGDTLHDSPTPITLPSDRSRPIPKWTISTLVDATKLLASPSMCYQEESPQPRDEFSRRI